MKTGAITTQEILDIARAVAKRYARKCWWADLDDLTQQASQAVIVAQQYWDPQVGVPFAGYATRAATAQLSTYLWSQSSPLSGGLHRPREVIAGVIRAPFIEEEHPSDRDVIGELDAAHWRRRVRGAIKRLARQTPDGHLAVEVLVRGRTPADVRAETGGNVYRAVMLVRRKMRDDRVLYELWKRTIDPTE